MRRQIGILRKLHSVFRAYRYAVPALDTGLRTLKAGLAFDYADAFTEAVLGAQAAANAQLLSNLNHAVIPPVEMRCCQGDG